MQMNQEFIAALAAAQAEFPDIPKDKTAEIKSDKGAYSYTYSDLATILRVTRPALTKHGFALSQPIQTHPSKPGWQITTILAHKSGSQLESTIDFIPSQRMQDTGSTITYLKRYSVTSMLGISGEDDDDGGRSSPPRQQNTNQNRAPAPRAQASTPNLPKPKTDVQPGSGASPSAPPNIAHAPPPTQAVPSAIPEQDLESFKMLVGSKHPYWDGTKVVAYISAKYQRKLTAHLTMPQFTELWDTVEKLTFQQAIEVAMPGSRKPDPTVGRYDPHDPSFDAGLPPGPLTPGGPR